PLGSHSCPYTTLFRSRILELVAKLRSESAQPIILFGYYNPFFRYGVERIAADAAAAGADGFLCVDLPPEEAGDLRAAARGAGLRSEEHTSELQSRVDL